MGNRGSVVTNSSAPRSALPDIRFGTRGSVAAVADFVGQGAEMLFQGLVAFRDSVQMGIVGRDFLLEDE